MLVHETTYKGRGAVSLVHRMRLRRCLRLFRSLDLPDSGAMADFGCSNGYILGVLQQQVFAGKAWRFAGFDHSEELLAMAREKNLPGTTFEFIDLNVVERRWAGQFDVVSCLETLEHTGNFRNALRTVIESCNVGGRIVLSIPNERGIPGLLKFFGRQLVRRRPYGDFFAGKSAWAYLWRVACNRRIDGFRDQNAAGWGPHLGFDWAAFEDVLRTEWIEPGHVRLASRQATFGGFNRFYILDRLR